VIEGHRTVVGLYWQGETEEFGEKPVPVSLHPARISHLNKNLVPHIKGTAQ
jgi:hypothetical protein